MSLRNKDKRRTYQREWVRQRRADLITFLGGKCIGCGSTENLQMMKTDGKRKPLPSTLRNRPRTEWPDLKKLLAVMCSTCNGVQAKNKLRWNGSTRGKHGINAYNRHGCRCLQCYTERVKDHQKRRAMGGG